MRKKPQIKFNTLYIKDKKPLGKVAFIFSTVQKTDRVDDGGAKTRQREISPSVSTKTPASQRERDGEGEKSLRLGTNFRVLCVYVCVWASCLGRRETKSCNLLHKQQLLWWTTVRARRRRRDVYCRAVYLCH